MNKRAAKGLSLFKTLVAFSIISKYYIIDYVNAHREF